MRGRFRAAGCSANLVGGAEVVLDRQIDDVDPEVEAAPDRLHHNPVRRVRIPHDDQFWAVARREESGQKDSGIDAARRGEHRRRTGAPHNFLAQ